MEVASNAQHHDLQLVDDDSEFPDYANIEMFTGSQPEVCFSNVNSLIVRRSVRFKTVASWLAVLRPCHVAHRTATAKTPNTLMLIFYIL